MKNWNVILGVDVSKLSLDICCAERRLHIKIENCSKGFKQFIQWCRLNGITLNEVLVLLEYTGGYEYRFLQFCELSILPIAGFRGLRSKSPWEW